MNFLLIGGKFDENGGRKSGYFNRFSREFYSITKKIHVLNGGYFLDLKNTLNTLLSYDVIIWFADVPNTFEKLVDEVKVINPKCILVTSKNNIKKQYTYMDLISRSLKVKSNLLVEFQMYGDIDNLISATIIDPLGNCFLKDSILIPSVVKTIYNRVKELTNFKRIGSLKVGDGIDVPKIEEFFSRIRTMSDKFHEIIHGIYTTRFLGNTSFRCINGFPSMKLNDGKICVSKRNIDKRELNENGFVVVENDISDGKVKYYGVHKPSVDTPVQILLYQNYKKINFMVHSHVYIDGVKFTKNVIPCGAIEEANEIFSLEDKDSNDFAVNLIGHGSIILVDEVEKMDKYKFIPRTIPEIINY